MNCNDTNPYKALKRFDINKTLKNKMSDRHSSPKEPSDQYLCLV